ncbi:MAG TPA: hypothetical protein VHX11_11060 [Acidobacteriaceae bacterium]|nr:hypothetical protein [Acidobacteriaceae bacterium]
MGLSLQRAEAEYAAGCQALAMGDDSSALAAFNQARSRWRSPIFDAGAGLAYASIALGEASSAALSSPLPPASPNTLAALGPAKKAFAAAVSRSPNDATFWCNLGWVNAFLQDHEGTEIAFRQAIKVDPYDFPSLVSIGLFEERENRTSSAADFYARAIAISPRILRSEFWAQFKSRNGLLGESIVRHSMQLLLKNPESPIRAARLGVIYAYLGNESAAREQYAHATLSLPDLSYAWSNLGYVMSSSVGQSARRDYLRRALLLDPSNVDAATQMAQVSFENGDMATAEQFYGRALATPEHSPHVERVSRVYGLPISALDDLMPPGFLSFITPRPDFVKICGSDWNDMLSELTFVNPFLRKRIDEQNEYCDR